MSGGEQGNMTWFQIAMKMPIVVETVLLHVSLPLPGRPKEQANNSNIRWTTLGYKQQHQVSPTIFLTYETVLLLLIRASGSRIHPSTEAVSVWTVCCTGLYNLL